VQSFPYLITLLVLAGFVGKAVPPKEVGVPYDPM
jgi:simple sugar transport system permease protein